MRATKTWVAPLALLLAVAGCDDLLTETPDSFLTPDNFYRTAADAEAAVLSAYQPLMHANALRQWVLAALDAASDRARVGPLEPNPNTRVLGLMAWTPGSSAVANPWGEFYVVVTRTNLVLDRLPGVQMSDARREALAGEAKFLRAFAYFYLVRLYGDVPLITDAPDPSLKASRTPKEQVYQQIIKDAQDAAKVLPVQWSAANAGRPTRGAALTLLADVHLTRQEWQQAADLTRQVMDLGVYRLYDNYLHAFLPAYENGPEHVFSLQANGPTTPNGSTYIGMYAPREVGAGRGGGWGMVQPTQAQLDAYVAGDYRKDASYTRDWMNLGTGRLMTVSYPHVNKYRPSQVTNLTAGDVDVPIYRYAEVLLMHAEALNELGRGGEAVQYLNQIRARARKADGQPRTLPADYSGALGKDVLREAIFEERARELAHEGKRWFDLVRRGEAYFMSQMRNDPEPNDLEPTDMLWPVPQTEIDVNPLLTQNPGY